MQLVSVSCAFLSNQSVPIDSFISVAAKLGVHFNDSFFTSQEVLCLFKGNVPGLGQSTNEEKEKK